MTRRVLALPLGNIGVASSRTRIYQPFESMASRGLLGVHVCRGAGLGWRGRYLEFMLRAPFARVLVVQKDIRKSMHSFVSFCKHRLGKKIVYDVDDPVWEDFPIADAYLKLADLVLVENAFNAAHVKKVNPGAKILEMLGPIDLKFYAPVLEKQRAKQPGTEVTLGWIGSGPTSKNLRFVCDAIEEVGQKHPGKIKLVLVGASKERVAHNFQHVEVEYRHWGLEKERIDLAGFDIGLMPLEDSYENRGKGGYKLLQYMACGIPSVCSGVGVNPSLIEDGVRGYCVNPSNPKEEWVEVLEKLVTNAKARRRMGEAGYEYVQRFGLEEYAKKLAGALAKL